jgi:hypothetical protein
MPQPAIQRGVLPHECGVPFAFSIRRQFEKGRCGRILTKGIFFGLMMQRNLGPQYYEILCSPVRHCIDLTSFAPARGRNG